MSSAPKFTHTGDVKDHRPHQRLLHQESKKINMQNISVMPPSPISYIFENDISQPSRRFPTAFFSATFSAFPGPAGRISHRDTGGGSCVRPRIWVGQGINGGSALDLVTLVAVPIWQKIAEKTTSTTCESINNSSHIHVL